MKITVNGDNMDVAATTMADLLVELAYDGKIATALNEEFVAASNRNNVELHECDRVEILAPMQGG
jgi:sulfur carrier protein